MNVYEKLSIAYQFYVLETARLRKQGDVLRADLADAKATAIAVEMMSAPLAHRGRP